jgi:L-ascorbate metabolism protein UlaG (beta-lactamase superfamily)
VILTHIGGPTLLIEIADWRLLTDPTFDPSGGHYKFGWGTSSDKVTGPALDLPDLPPIDAVLLTHDHHGDNLDASGRQLLSTVGTVLTTVSGARRLTGTDVRGLAAGEVARLTAPDRPDLEVTATPARHGPPLSRPIVGDVVGFAVRGTDDTRVLVWITGDTVLYDRLRDVAKGMSVDVLVTHVGGVQFPVTGPLRYTMTGRHAVELVDLVSPRVAVPVHYEGWSHFRDGRTGVERALAQAPETTRSRVRWLELGWPTDLS